MPANDSTLCSAAELAEMLSTAGAVGCPKNLDQAAAKLNEYLHQFLGAHPWDKAPPPSESLERLTAIRTAAKALGKLLLQPTVDGPGPNPDQDTFARLGHAANLHAEQQHAANWHKEQEGGYRDFPPIKSADGRVFYRGVEKLRATIEAVSLIELWAGQAAERARNRVGRSGERRNRGDEAINTLLEDLDGLWREFNLSVSFNEANGNANPLIRFTLALRDHLLDRLGSLDLQHDPRLANSLRRLQPKAVRDRYQRIRKPPKRAVGRKSPPKRR
jgi:hypothetical protein